jgi:hypothetical protein
MWAAEAAVVVVVVVAAAVAVVVAGSVLIFYVSRNCIVDRTAPHAKKPVSVKLV